jgi:hypothetical protein
MCFSQVTNKSRVQFVLLMAGMLLLGVFIVLSFHYRNATVEKKNRIANVFLDKYHGRLKKPAVSFEQVEISSNFIVVKEFRSAAFAADTKSLLFQVGPDVDLNDQGTIHYVLFISPEIYQSRSYKSTDLSVLNRNIRGTKRVETYRLKVWVFDDKSATLIAYREFLPPLLKRRYYDDKPELAAHNDVRKWIHRISGAGIRAN